MKINRSALVFAVSTAIISGCSSTDEKSSLSENKVPAAEIGTPVTTAGYSDNWSLSGKELATDALDNMAPRSDMQAPGSQFNDPANLLSKQTIYFMYDSSQIQQSFVAVVAAHAQYLLGHPGQRVILEGHADERGSREYNIALGEQRAKSVHRMMKSHGVPSSQLEIVSYGEEKATSDGMNEASWKLNRRVEIAYLVQ